MGLSLYLVFREKRHLNESLKFSGVEKKSIELSLGALLVSKCSSVANRVRTGGILFSDGNPKNRRKAILGIEFQEPFQVVLNGQTQSGVKRSALLGKASLEPGFATTALSCATAGGQLAIKQQLFLRKN